MLTDALFLCVLASVMLQEGCFKQVKDHHRQVFNCNTALSLQRGVRMMTGNPLATSPTDELLRQGFQRYSLLAYRNNIQNASRKQSRSVLETENTGALLLVPWCKQKMFVDLGAADQDMINRFITVRFPSWAFLIKSLFQKCLLNFVLCFLFTPFKLLCICWGVGVVQIDWTRSTWPLLGIPTSGT